MWKELHLPELRDKEDKARNTGRCMERWTDGAASLGRAVPSDRNWFPVAARDLL